MLTVLLLAAAALEAINGLVMIGHVGAKGEDLAKHYTGPRVAFTVALTAAIVAVLCVAAVRLSRG